MIKAILVDDDPGSIKTLKLCLAEFKRDIEIISTYTDPSKAVTDIQKMKPDVLFLDIDMPIINGLSLAKETFGHYGELIFVTGYEKYWKDAFNIHAFQFLLKPIRDEKLAAAINDLVEREKNGWLGLWQQRIQDMEESRKGDNIYFDYIWLSGSKNGLDKVFWQDIVLFEKPKNGKNEILIHMKNGVHYNKKNTTLSIIEADILKLEKYIKEKFWRINDWQILNLQYAASFHPNNRILFLDDAACRVKPEYSLNITRPEALHRIDRNKLRSRP